MIDKHVIRKIFNREEIRDNPTCYIYSLDIVRENILNIQKNACDNVKLYYAMKANPNYRIIEEMKKHEFIKGIEIASVGEMEKALELYDASQILFTGPGKTEKELEEAIVSKIRLINCESTIEAIRINKIAERLKLDKINILLRINPNYYISGAMEYMAGESSKMGIDEDIFWEEYCYISSLPHIQVKGIHVFAASGVLDYNDLIAYAKYIFELVDKFEGKGLKIEIIDFGGGIGIDYTYNNQEFNISAYFSELNKLIRKFGYESKEIIMELGKYLVGNAGVYATKIIDIKNSKGKKHIVTAGGVNHMRLPIATERKHPLFIVSMGEKKIYERQNYVNQEVVDVEGPLCMSEDLISWDELIEHAEIGDIVVLKQAGAYCYSASTLWLLSHKFPEEIFVN